MDRVRTNDLHLLDVYRCALDLYRRIGQIDGLASLEEIIAAQDLADRIAAMLTKLICSAEAQAEDQPAAHPVA